MKHLINIGKILALSLCICAAMVVLIRWFMFLNTCNWSDDFVFGAGAGTVAFMIGSLLYGSSLLSSDGSKYRNRRI